MRMTISAIVPADRPQPTERVIEDKGQEERTVNKKLFGELVESMTQIGQIVPGERKPSREIRVDSEMLKGL
jgi:hypothetical protein